VQAVNEYGISAARTTTDAVKPKSATKLPLKSIQMLHLSDFHGQVEANRTFGAALLSLNLDAERANNEATFTMSSGDNIGAAPPISSQFAEVPTIKALNLMKFDVSNFGNHEHDRPLTHLRQMIRFSDFQWVTSNYNTLRGLDAGNGKRAKSFVILDRGGVKVGVVGVNTKDTPDQIMPGNLDFTYAGTNYSIEISDDTSRINAAANAARAAGADMVVALIHEGWNSNTGGKAVGPLIDYAKTLDVDLVYGAHSHQTYSSVHNGTLTAMVRNAGVEYNRTQVCVNTETNTVLGASNEVITTANAPVKSGGDAAVTAMVAGYKATLNAKMDVKVGKVATITPIGGTPPVQRSGEHAFGNWSADIVRAKYKTDFALMNGGGIRSTFPASTYTPADKTLVRSGATGPYDIVLGDIYTIQPFGNVFSVIEVTGTQLWAALENGVSRYPSDGRWPHVSGMKLTVDVTKPVGSRIVSITDLEGAAIAKDSKTYTLALTDFVAKGGDGYNMFDVSKLQVRDLDAEVIAEALRADAAAGKITEMKLDGRITVIK
jgi:5'-nucleotidase